MSYLTAERLEQELQRLHSEIRAEPSVEVVLYETRTRVRFRAKVGAAVFDFSIPEDALHNAPLSYVSDKYLRPLIDASAPPSPT